MCNGMDSCELLMDVPEDEGHLNTFHGFIESTFDGDVWNGHNFHFTHTIF